MTAVLQQVVYASCNAPYNAVNLLSNSPCSQDGLVMLVSDCSDRDPWKLLKHKEAKILLMFVSGLGCVYLQTMNWEHRNNSWPDVLPDHAPMTL